MISNRSADWGAQIRRFRRLNSLKQAALADTLGVDQATISRWERRGTIPDARMQRRLLDLMRRELRDEALLRHRFTVSFNQVMMSNVQRIIQAASASYCAAHGVATEAIVGVPTDPMATEEVMRLWRMAYDYGFFRGELASVTIVVRGNSLSGHIRDRPGKIVWTPLRLTDGEILRHVERRDLTEEEFVRAREENGGAIRIVSVENLLQ